MKTSQMQSLVDAVRFSAKGESLDEAKTYKGLDAFKDDESMLDDLENDLQDAGLKSGKDYTLDLDKGTLTIKKNTPRLKQVLRIYRLKEGVQEEVVEIDEKESADLNKDNAEKAVQHD